MHVVFMVAGMSSRYGGKLKQLANVGVNNETLIEVTVNQALTVPFSKIIFITNKRTEHHFVKLFGDSYKGVPVSYVQQPFDEDTRDRPWGTTGAVCALNSHVDEPFILVNSDDLYGEKTFKKGYDLMTEKENNIIGGCLLERTMPKDENTLVNRGVIEVNEAEGVVENIEERLNISVHKNPDLLSKLASVNFIGLYPKTLTYLITILEDFQRKHMGDRKIEALLPTDLNYLIKYNIISMNYFLIENPIHSITYPGDEANMKLIIALSSWN